MRSARGAYIGLVGIESGLATVALAARTDIPGASLKRADELLERHWPGLGAVRASEWMACPIGASGLVFPGHVRSFRIGNAAAAVEPIGGEGIGLALWSGWLVGTQLATCPRPSRENLNEVQRSVARAYRRKLATRLPACRLAAEVLMRPALVSALWPLVRWPRLLIGPWYGLTGKRVSA
jgi:flavin-dependent dehydrogenase